MTTRGWREARASPAARRVGVALALAACAALACGGADRGRPVQELELVDLPVPAMYLEVARGLGKAHVVEIPDAMRQERHALSLRDTSEAEVLEAIRALDPRWRHEMGPDVLVAWPGVELQPASPFATRLATFQAAGGAGSVVRELVVAAGLERRMRVVTDPRGQSRPVTVTATDATLREILADVAAQAHLAIQLDPSSIRLAVAPE